VHALQQRFSGVFIVSCPPAACQMRHGADLAYRRFIGKQEPADKAGLDDARLRLLQLPAADSAGAWAELRAFAGALGLLAPSAPEPRRRRHLVMAFAAMLPWAVLLGFLAAARAGEAEAGSALRLTWRLPGQALRICRDLSPEELSARPAHMRRKQECTTRRLSYRLQLNVDGSPRVDKRYAPKGAHGDSPLNVDLDLPLEAGRHDVELSFVPDQEDQGQGRRLAWKGLVELTAGRVALLGLDGDGKALEMNANSR
jgi:hypothetical protein